MRSPTDSVVVNVQQPPQQRPFGLTDEDELYDGDDAASFSGVDASQPLISAGDGGSDETTPLTQSVDSIAVSLNVRMLLLNVVYIGMHSVSMQQRSCHSSSLTQICHLTLTANS